MKVPFIKLESKTNGKEINEKSEDFLRMCGMRLALDSIHGQMLPMSGI
jgi:hypothetical protein